MVEGTQFMGDELPIFDGIGSGYGWSILAQQFWNARGTPEAQRLLEVSSAFSGRSLIWFQLWSLRNPKSDWDTFDLAFLHQFQPDMRPILPEICWKEVEDWEIEWIEMRAKLLQQPEIDPGKIKYQQEQEIIAASAAEIQEKIEAKVDSDLASTYHLIIGAESQAEAEFEVSEQHLNSATKENADTDATNLIDHKLNFTGNPAEEEEAIRSDNTSVRQSGTRRTTHSGTEVGAGAEEMVVADLYRGTITEDDEAPDLHTSNGDNKNVVAAMGEQRTFVEGAATMLGDGPKAQAVRRAMLLNPPPLMAAVFPWNRGSKDMAARQGEREIRMEEEFQMSLNGPKFRDQGTGGNKYGGGRLLQELLIGVLEGGTMNTTLWKEKAEHGEKERRVAALCKVTNEVEHWKPLLPLVGQCQTRILQPALSLLKPTRDNRLRFSLKRDDLDAAAIIKQKESHNVGEFLDANNASWFAPHNNFIGPVTLWDPGGVLCS